MTAANAPLPENNRKFREFDCAAFEFASDAAKNDDSLVFVGAARGDSRPALVVRGAIRDGHLEQVGDV
jgi:hypothetical protein